MTYTQALDYIHAVDWRGSRPGLSRITELAERLGNPQNTLSFVHVAGTNGKGSTSVMLASVLQAAGYRVGLYTSPYILRFNERIQINGTPISDEDLAALVEEIRPVAEDMADPPTEFELITALAFLYFAKEACDVVVLEVGLGGRLDATNIIPSSLVSVITGIAMDHTAILGDTPAKIAAEKAGILRSGVPVVYGGGGGEAADVIRQHAHTLGSPFVAVNHDGLSQVQTHLDGASFDFEPLALYDLRLSMAGSYQPRNAACVLTVLSVLQERGLTVSETAIREGLAAAHWPGRFEILCRDPLIISDGGHNPEGVHAAVNSVKQCLGDTRVMLLSGVMADKDYRVMVEDMASVARRVFTVKPSNPRSLDAHDYAAMFRRAGVPAEAFETVDEGVAAAVRAASAEGCPLLSLGSLYLYAELHTALKNQNII